MPGIIADRALCLTVDRDQVVEAGDPRSAFVLVSRAGKEIPAAEVARLGLELVDGYVQQVQVKERESAQDRSEDPPPKRKK